MGLQREALEVKKAGSSMRNVSKEIFLNGIVCPTLGWLIRSGEIDTPEETLGERFRKEQGIEIGRRGRSFHPRGVLVNESGLESAAERTKDLMTDSRVSTIYEGTFLVDGYVAKADILKRFDGSWQMVEVKSSVNDRPEFIDDMAYTFMVIGRSDVSLSRASLLLLSKDFRLGLSDERLFVELDHTDEVQARAELFESLWESVEEKTRIPVKPTPALRFECGACRIFGECLGKDIENHIFEIPRLSRAKFDELKESGIICIEDIPDEFPLTENQARVRHCVQMQNILVDPELKQKLESIAWPAYYLDFETVMTAIPLYPNIAPYTQLPTQYSIHKCSAPGQVEDHFGYLSDPSRDGRKELAEHLIKDLSHEGSIITYSNFEKTLLNNLAETYPNLSEELSFDKGRIVDLAAIIQKHFYHPDFHGSTSIKTTLPVFVPELSYDDLEIGDGGSAAATFAYVAMGRLKEEDAESAKRNLLKYCERDTLALVKLHEHLVKHCNGRS
jgi:hypothetical protein